MNDADTKRIEAAAGSVQALSKAFADLSATSMHLAFNLEVFAAELRAMKEAETA